MQGRPTVDVAEACVTYWKTRALDMLGVARRSGQTTRAPASPSNHASDQALAFGSRRSPVGGWDHLC